jgi:hypothetical protein
VSGLPILRAIHESDQRLDTVASEGVLLVLNISPSSSYSSSRSAVVRPSAGTRGMSHAFRHSSTERTAPLVKSAISSAATAILFRQDGCRRSQLEVDRDAVLVYSSAQYSCHSASGN